MPSVPHSRSVKTSMYQNLNEKSLCWCDYIDHLHSISLALLENDDRDISNSIQTVLRLVSKELGVLKVMISIYNRKTGNIFIESAQGLSKAELSRGIYKVGEGIIGRVVESGLPLIVPKISEEPMFLDRTDSRQHINKDEITFICYPLKVNKEVVGTISVDRHYTSKNTLEDDVKFISVVATMISQAVHIHQIAHEERLELEEENQRLQHELREKFQPSNIIGNANSMRQVYYLINKVSDSNATVLILGESGVGKELVANAIHYNSNRSHKPFVKFNCAALVEGLVESELFGHEKGAFTGANSTRIGKFEQADGGSIFLDEIGEVSLTVQAKLLRVIQEKELERVGGTKMVQTDVRIIAATNRDLLKLIQQGQFREDLYYRLNTFPIIVPSLRERQTDIPLLIDYFLEKYSKLHNKGIRRISTQTIDMLMSYHWPGNVRELENCIERSVILSEEGVVRSHHLPPTLQTADSSNTRQQGTLAKILQTVEHEIIIETLKNTKGNMAKAAKELGLTERVMNLRVHKYNIDFKKFRR
jgi:Nif-specific regulatory protein